MTTNKILLSAGAEKIPVRLSKETEQLVASILDERPTTEVYAKYLQRMLEKSGSEAPVFLIDIELALLDDLMKALPDRDFSVLTDARDAWQKAFSKLLPVAQKGLALLTRAVRSMFSCSQQADFERKVSRLVDALAEPERVPALEFVEDLLSVLDDLLHKTETTNWEVEQVNYIDNHVYYQLYEDILLPAVDNRGKSLVTRRFHVLSRLIRSLRF